MSEELRQRIAEVLGRHWLEDYARDAIPAYYCECGQDFTGLDNYIAHVADAVIKAWHLP